jgi:hypothetical protein
VREISLDLASRVGGKPRTLHQHSPPPCRPHGQGREPALTATARHEEYGAVANPKPSLRHPGAPPRGRPTTLPTPKAAAAKPPDPESHSPPRTENGRRSRRLGGPSRTKGATGINLCPGKPSTTTFLPCARAMSHGPQPRVPVAPFTGATAFCRLHLSGRRGGWRGEGGREARSEGS